MEISERIWGSLPQAGNVTPPSVAPATETQAWEPPIIVVVGIFCCVCVLHLSAFVYAICFRIQKQPIPASTQKTSEGNEAITLHSSSLGTHECSGGNFKEGKGSVKSGSCWSSF